MDNFNEITKKIGEELGVKVTLLSDGWTTLLEKDNKKCYISGYFFDLNGHGLGKIIDEKDLFYELMKHLNIPIIEHYVIFHGYNKQDVLDYFHKNNNEIIVKGCLGHSGKNVFKVNSEDDLFTVIDNEFVRQYSIALCPYYKIRNEYRAIVLNNEIKFMYGKIKPIVIGDGKKTVLELAKEFNDYYVDNPNEIKNPNYIPKENEKIELNFKFNLLSGGKTFIDINPDLKKKISELALRVTKEANIPFASVDIIDTMDNELMVMEANSGVKMDILSKHEEYYEIVYKIYKDAVKLMFDL